MQGDLLSVAREFLASNKLEPWEDVTVPVSAVRRLAEAVVKLSAALHKAQDMLDWAAEGLPYDAKVKCRAVVADARAALEGE
jgi:hypothetical protein